MNNEKPIVENVVIADGENERTFVHCPENLEGEFTIPEGVTAIAPLAFKNCSQLESIVIPNSVRHIGHHAFEGCTAIKEIQIFTFFECVDKLLYPGLAHTGLPADFSHRQLDHVVLVENVSVV